MDVMIIVEREVEKFPWTFDGGLSGLLEALEGEDGKAEVRLRGHFVTSRSG